MRTTLGLNMLTFKRIVAAWILWCGADLIAVGVLTTTHILSVEGRSSGFARDTEFVIWLIVSICLGIGCFKLAWTKIK
jgi:hypothetical protein